MKISYLADCESDKSCVTFHDQLELCEKELEDFVRWCNQRAILSCKVRWYNKHDKIQSTFLVLKRHYKINTRSQLQINENWLFTSDAEIPAECKTPFTLLFNRPSETQPSGFFPFSHWKFSLPGIWWNVLFYPACGFPHSTSAHPAYIICVCLKKANQRPDKNG